jgi:release factor glutamine methyltransferase
MSGRTVGAAVKEAARVLAAAGIVDAGLDARRMAAYALGLDAVGLVLAWERELRDSEATQLERLVARRQRREPVSRLLGRRGFYGRDFAIDANTLDPRPETEVLVETALELLAATAAPRILEIGTGSGCLIVSILAERSDATGVGTDISQGALDMTRRNAETHGVSDRLELVRTDLAAGLAGHFDLVVSNPPYIPSGEIGQLEPEVRQHDPLGALDGGGDGLEFYRRIAPAAARLTQGRGAVALEVGAGQAAPVRGMLGAAFPGGQLLSRSDLGGIERCIAVRQARSP